jgi:hypothetical protein
MNVVVGADASSLLQMFAGSFIPTDQHGQEDPHQEAYRGTRWV